MTAFYSKGVTLFSKVWIACFSFSTDGWEHTSNEGDVFKVHFEIASARRLSAAGFRAFMVTLFWFQMIVGYGPLNSEDSTLRKSP